MGEWQSRFPWRPMHAHLIIDRQEYLISILTENRTSLALDHCTGETRQPDHRVVWVKPGGRSGKGQQEDNRELRHRKEC